MLTRIRYKPALAYNSLSLSLSLSVCVSFSSSHSFSVSMTIFRLNLGYSVPPWCPSCTTVCLKKCPTLTCYSLDIHYRITIIFGRSVTKKVGNHMMLCFPTSPIWCFCTTLLNRKPRNYIFSLKHFMLRCQRSSSTQNTFKLSPGRC